MISCDSHEHLGCSFERVEAALLGESMGFLRVIEGLLVPAPRNGCPPPLMLLVLTGCLVGLPPEFELFCIAGHMT